MSEKLKPGLFLSIAKRVAGVLCIIIGFLALVTPFTPGSWLIFVGLTLLGITIEVSEDHRFASWAKRVGFKIKRKAGEVRDDLISGDT